MGLEDGGRRLGFRDLKAGEGPGDLICLYLEKGELKTSTQGFCFLHSRLDVNVEVSQNANIPQAPTLFGDLLHSSISGLGQRQPLQSAASRRPARRDCSQSQSNSTCLS